MSETTAAVQASTLGLHSLEQYEPFVGAAAIERILKKADPLRAMQTLQGETIEVSEADKAIYEQVVFENATRLHIEDCDALIVHDPQPLPLVEHFKERDVPWIWQCHVDLSAPNPAAWSYLRGFVEQYDSAILSMPDYAQQLGIEQRFIAPAINPFSPKNREMSDDEIDACSEHYRVPSDRPLVVQVSRFDRWKDPLGVIEAFRKATEQVDATLVLVGNNAVDDPECEVILETIQSSLDERVVVLTVDDPNLVNALQRRAAVVLQKSIREGFGLTVTEAMWKGAAVVGSNVGGIRRQIRDGQNGFLVGSIDPLPNASRRSSKIRGCAKSLVRVPAKRCVTIS